MQTAITEIDQVLVQAPRVITIAHRLKEIVRDGVVIEKRPTQLAIAVQGGVKFSEIALKDESDELDFLLARNSDDPESTSARHNFAENGLRAGDVVLAQMGGSGAFFAFALSRRLEELGSGGVYWISSTVFKRVSDEQGIDRSRLKKIDDDGRRVETTFDHLALHAVAKVAWPSFYRVGVRERDNILLRAAYEQRKEAMLARMATAARVRQRAIGRIFCNATGKYPEGKVEDLIRAELANDKVLSALQTEEARAERELKKLLRSLPVWNVFDPIEGVGELTAAPLVVAIQDINRFAKPSSLVAFLGVHCLKADGSKFQKGEHPTGGILARRRRGQLSNWHPDGRQALFQIGQQFALWRPHSPWGQVFSVVRAGFVEKHPNRQVWVRNGSGEVIERIDLVEGHYKRIAGGYVIPDGNGGERTVKGSTKYNPLHLTKMAMWRTMTLFVGWLWEAWRNAEVGKSAPKLPRLKIDADVVADQATGT
jgi:hypothetical protein